MRNVIGTTPPATFLATVFITSVLPPCPAHPHDAVPTNAKPQGWSYPYSCCSGIDCRQVSEKAISERPEGYVINGTGEVVTYKDHRVKYSPDGVYHWCSVAGAEHSKTICLFVPSKSF